MNDLVVAESLGKSFGKVTAVKSLDFSIGDGEIVAMIGKSGSGKSTVLAMLAGLEQPTNGRVLYKGEDLTQLDEDSLALWRRSNIGLVFQAFHLIPTLTALENVAFPLYPTKVPASERRERAARGLELVGLGDRSDHRPSELSGGEQQRVAIARSLINKPGLILADEPTGNLDSETGKDVLERFRRLSDESGVALLIVTHDPEVADSADRIVEMKDGELVNE